MNPKLQKSLLALPSRTRSTAAWPPSTRTPFAAAAALADARCCESDAVPQHVLVPGDVVAERYAVQRVIGAGGMGIVYEAKHLALGTRVALKVIRPDIAQNSSIWRRFAREARALGALHNKHVVRVHDAGTLPLGLRYLVMEYLAGVDLRRILAKEGPLATARAVDYVLQVCSALSDAHRLGIVHRDIKPENIFLAKFRACEPVVKLLDFGVALFLDEAAQLTLPGRGIGSAYHLSPEQLENPSAVDARSDLWAVGLLLFELISGRSPFEGLNAAEACLRIARGALPRVESVCPAIPPELANIIHRCLQLDREDRPQTADELSAVLEPYSSRHVPVTPTPVPPAVVKTSRRARRRRQAWASWLGGGTGAAMDELIEQTAPPPAVATVVR